MKAISVEKLSKSYRLGQIGTGTFSHDLNVWFAKIRGKPNPMAKIGAEDQGNLDDGEIWALNDITFSVEQGEILGIIGRNGAGKSTLLKILSRVTAPTTGKIKVRGRIASLLEVGTGFHPDLTGRENLFLNGAILGMSRDEISKKFEEIVDFSGVEKFIDTPVKRYSSGMYVRLAFAVAAHLDPEILVVDEVLSVGDAEFQKKCIGKMGDVAKEGRTVLFVSHNLPAIRGLCQNGILLDNGTIKNTGTIESVLDTYLNSGIINNHPFIIIPDDPSNLLQLNVISIKNEKNLVSGNIPYTDPFFLEIDFSVRETINRYYIAIHIHDSELSSLIFLRDFEIQQDLLLERQKGHYRYRIQIPAPLLVPGRYSVSVHVVKLGEGKKISVDHGCQFEIIDTQSEQVKVGLDWNRKINPHLKLEISAIPQQRYKVEN